MTFQSVSYLLFLLLACGAAYSMSAPRGRQAALLAASYLFYATWGLSFALLLFLSSTFNYFWARRLRSRPGTGSLWLGLGVNIGLLAGFKYVNSVLAVLGLGSHGAFHVLVPVGISFYTFQAMSWILDVYRGSEEDPTLLEFLLYMAFWPTILAGPVCRLPEMLHQFRRVEGLSSDDLAIGSRRILAGLFMKVVIAETLSRGLYEGEGTAYGFDRATGWGGADVAFLALAFGLQLFFDFAGYSNIAIGSARLLGIRLRENFNDPYLSTSPTQFWTRWHMSLSSWIRDYLFFPLASQRPGLLWRNGVLVLSMVVFGLWHGVGATFIVWGLYQGLLLLLHRQIQTLRQTRPASFTVPSAVDGLVSWAATFACITLGWLLFRPNTLAQSASMFRALVTPAGWTTLTLRPNFYIIVFLTIVGYFVYALAKPLLPRLFGDPRGIL